MTKQEYQLAIEAIERKYLEDRAAMERAWLIMNGSQPPDGVVDVNGGEHVGLINGADLRGAITGGSPSSEFTRQTIERKSLKGLSPEQKKARRAAYMKTYWLKKKRKAAA